MKKVVQLYEAGLEEYPVRDVIGGNLAMAALIVAGTLACWFISPLFGIVYATLSVLVVYVVMRRLVCTRCHYFGKRCGTGWGVLAAMWFPRGRIEEFNTSPGVRLAPVVYGLMALLPLVAITVALLGGPNSSKLVVLGLLLALSFYSMGPGRRCTCSVCKMRLFCKGSAAK